MDVIRVCVCVCVCFFSGNFEGALAYAFKM